MPGDAAFNDLVDRSSLRTTWRSTQYTEVTNDPKGPIEEFRQNGSTSVRTYLVRWEDRYPALADFLGYATVLTASDGYKCVSRITPHYHTEFLPANFRVMYATQCMRCEPVGMPTSGGLKSSANFIRAKWAKITLQYESLPFDVLEDQQVVGLDVIRTIAGPDEAQLARYVTKSFKPSAETLMLPQQSFKFVSGSTPVVPGAPPKLVPAVDISLTWHWVPQICVGLKLINPDLSHASIDDCLGTVNQSEIWGCKPGTLLLVGVDVRPIISPFGERIYDIEYRFKYLNLKDTNGEPVGHNFLYAQKSIINPAGYYEVSVDGATNVMLQDDDKNIYNWREFRSLFRVDYPTT